MLNLLHIQSTITVSLGEGKTTNQIFNDSQAREREDLNIYHVGEFRVVYIILCLIQQTDECLVCGL